MIDGLKPYPDLIDSGLPWLGLIPAHWEVRRTKFVFREVDRRSESGEETQLSMSQTHGLIESSKIDTWRMRSESYAGGKLCEAGDLVLNRLKAHLGVFAHARMAGVISPDYSVFRPKSHANSRYFESVLRTPLCVAEIRRFTKGIVEGFWRLYTDDFYNLRVPIPPLDEQAAIVRFLDNADRRIGRFIRAKRQLIALLNEQKQAIIHRAVTRGIDPHVPLKPSGIEWLGDVPTNWKLSRVKNEFHCLNNRRIPLSGPERGAMTIREYDYYGASGVIDKVDDFIFDDELLLIAEDGANLVLRNLPLAIIAKGKFWVNNHAHILKPRTGNLQYLAYLLESLSYLPWISGAAQPKLTKDRLLSIEIAVPSEAEQNQIVEAIERKTAPFNVIQNQAKREVEQMRDFRSRLISDVVTGKLDIRDAATSLSNEANESVPDANEIFGDQEVLGDVDSDTQPEEVEA